MFHVDKTYNIHVDRDLVLIIIAAVLFIVLYFFGSVIQKAISRIIISLSSKIGVYSVGRDFKVQRYVYQHSGSYVARLYNWVNNQLAALGLKRQGVTVVGYLIFWGFSAIVVGSILGTVLRLGVFFTLIFWVVAFVCFLIITRVRVSTLMEKRELDIMNAIDLIVPEAKNGIKNSIVTYQDNFAPSIREDFKAFIGNIQDRGFSFEDAMYVLTDNLGTMFLDFAQKSIYYEAIGDKGMIDIFTDLTETNRLRRQLRDENQATFANLKSSFIMSALIVCGYFVFLMITDDFSRMFFLQTTPGKILLIFCILVIFIVLSYISSIRSRSI